MKLNDIIYLKYKEDVDSGNIVLQDDGQGAFISKWGVSDPIPNKSTIKNWEVALDLKYRQEQAVMKRRYPSLQEQMDMQYKDLINGTTIWRDTIAAIKAADPKPTE